MELYSANSCASCRGWIRFAGPAQIVAVIAHPEFQGHVVAHGNEAVVKQSPTQDSGTKAPTVSTLVGQYKAEKMPERFSTRRGYNAWLKNHIVPKWGDCEITAVQARPVELWLQSLKLSPKSRAAVRGLLRILWDYAAWRGDVPMQRNPMELVTVKGATKRKSKPRSLTVDEFQKFVAHLGEPFHTLALVCVCFWFANQRSSSPKVGRCGLAGRQAHRGTRYCPSACG